MGDRAFAYASSAIAYRWLRLARHVRFRGRMRSLGQRLPYLSAEDQRTLRRAL